LLYSDEKLFFFQLPASLPRLRKSASQAEQPKPASAAARGGEDAGQNDGEEDSDEDGGHNFKSQAEEISSGTIGKLVVYKSGKMRMKIGNFIYDVSSGADCAFLQNVVAVDPKGGQAFVLGDVSKRFVVSPNVDSLLKEKEKEK
jgi:DNA-directed RNA polymerase III subunit RPC4